MRLTTLFADRAVCLVLLAAVVVLWAASPVRAQTPGGVEAATGAVGEPSMLHVEGDGEQLFLVFTQMMPVQGSGSRAESGAVYRRRVGGAEWQFLGSVGGRPTDVAIWRGQLAVLMTDGTWRTVYEGGSSAGIRPQEGQLLRLAGDGATLIGLLRLGDDLFVARLTSGRWEVLGGVPEEVASVRPPAIDLALVAGRAQLGWSGEGGLSVGFATAELGGEPDGPLVWERRATITTDETVVAVRVLRLEEGVGVWADPGTTSGGRLYVAEGEVWRSFGLGADAGEAAAFAGRVRLFFRSAEGATRPSVFSMPQAPQVMERVFTTDGEEVGPPQVVELVAGPGQGDLLKLLAVSLAMGGLMSALLISWRRRAELPPERVMAAFQLPLASRFKRLSAGLIDVSPFVVVSAYVVVSEGITFSEYLLTPRVMFYELLGIAFVVTHVTLSEVIAGRSLGKAIFGLRVTDMTGQRPAVGRVVLRSLFRAVDLILVVPLVTVAISPLRQSIGDGAAGTLVLEEGAGAEKRGWAEDDEG